jgi:hypothetical protein
VWWLDRVRYIDPRWLAHFSIALFGLSLCMPAISLQIVGSASTIMGWQAFGISFTVLPEVFFGDWLRKEPEDVIWAFAYVAGAVANVAFLVGYIAHRFIARFPRARTLTKRAALFGLASIIVVFVLLVASSELRGVYPGFGFWLASPLALYLGARPSAT